MSHTQSKEPREETYCKMVVPDFPELKTQSCRVIFNTPEGTMTFFWICQTTENIGNQMTKNWKNSAMWECRKPLELKIQLAECDMKFADTCAKLESAKSRTQRNLKHKAPSVRMFSDGLVNRLLVRVERALASFCRPSPFAFLRTVFLACSGN